MTTVHEKKALKIDWLRGLKKAIEAESWGQTLEAQDEYETLGTIIDNQLVRLTLSTEERSVLFKFRRCIYLRHLQLSDSTQNLTATTSRPTLATQKISLEEMKTIMQFLTDRLFIDNSNTLSEQFPFKVDNSAFNNPTSTSTMNSTSNPTNVIDASSDPTIDASLAVNFTQPLPAFKSSGTSIELYLDKIGLKDAEHYLQPRLCIQVLTKKGKCLEKQLLATSVYPRKPQWILFMLKATLETPLERIREEDAALFIEFVHYKADKKKMSTRCFAMMEPNEISAANEQSQSGVCLELYKKPVDHKRQQLHLFTIKQLFLHCTVTLTKH